MTLPASYFTLSARDALRLYEFEAYRPNYIVLLRVRGSSVIPCGSWPPGCEEAIREYAWREYLQTLRKSDLEVLAQLLADYSLDEILSRIASSKESSTAA